MAELGGGSLIHAAMRKYGTDSFRFDVLGEYNTWDDLKSAEISAIAKMRSRSPGGYNLTNGGDGILGMRHTPETIKKMSKSAVRTAEQRAALSEFRKGMTHSDETKQKIREARARQAPTFGMLGKKMTDETKAKMSDAAMGKKKSPETVQRMREAAARRMAIGKNGAINGKAKAGQ